MAASSSAGAGRVFISYRRVDSAFPAGWLYDRLCAHLGNNQVFKDVDSIEPGDDFVEVLTEAVGSCQVLLAVIGDRWLDITDETGQRRLDNPDDFVRIEIEAALRRNVRVVPLLVGRAPMPSSEQLPNSLRGLARRHAIQLSPNRFESDLARLLPVIDKTLSTIDDGPGAPETDAITKTVAAPQATLQERPTPGYSRSHRSEQQAAIPTESVRPETIQAAPLRTDGSQVPPRNAVAEPTAAESQIRPVVSTTVTKSTIPAEEEHSASGPMTDTHDPSPQPWFAHLSRGARIALVAATVALIAVVVAATIIFTQSRPPAGTTPSPSAPVQTQLPFTGLSWPAGVTSDIGGSVYVTDDSGRVLKLAPGANAADVMPFTGLNNPSGVAVDRAGDVYVADSGHNRVVELTAGTSTQTELPFTGLQGPIGVALDRAGDVYVADSGHNRVVELTAGTSTQTELPFTGLSFPHGLAVDSAGDVYVTDNVSGRVRKLAAGGSAQTSLPFTGLNNPSGVAVDNTGDIYVTDCKEDASLNGGVGVIKYDNNRVLKLAAGATTQIVLPFTGLNNPSGVAVDNTGDIYVTDYGNNRVVRLAPQ